jgi:hypothetical protein
MNLIIYRVKDYFVDKLIKKYHTLGCCGIDCGLCPRYYTEGASRCPGCFGENYKKKHPPCSFATCCVKNNNLKEILPCFLHFD